MRWIETDKGDPRGRVLADRHYVAPLPSSRVPRMTDRLIERRTA